MTNKITKKSRIISFILILSMLMTYIPLSMATVISAENGSNITSDAPTLDNWTNFFGKNHLSTENAGRVWTDKSVMTDASLLGVPGISFNNDGRSFLVALSTIGSNTVITGQSNSPADVMFVLDLSGSMDDSNNEAADDLVSATNESIATLYKTNPKTRVGVVLYSGPSDFGSASGNSTDAIVLLPLDTYTTNSSGQYLTYSSGNSERVGIHSAVLGSNGRAPQSQSKKVEGGTYIQYGLKIAGEQLKGTTSTTVVDELTGKEVTRVPVVVLMSDGAPTLATTNFTNPTGSNIGNGGSTGDEYGFVTQLTAAYTKKQIADHYKTGCLFYTLGFAVANDSVALGVLDPTNTNASAGMNSLWTNYNTANAGDSVRIYYEVEYEWQRNPETGRWEQVPVYKNEKFVTKSDAELAKDYVDGYFSASNTSSSASLQQAFKDIVAQIEYQTRYHPTLVGDNDELSGYVSFIDKIGEYMTVTDVKGLILGGKLLSGQKLAEILDDLGSIEQPAELGDEFIRSIRDRLGIEKEQAQMLVANAYANGQLSYNEVTKEFSNKFCWYSDANGKYLAPYPASAEYDISTAVYINTSYGFLGEADPAYGVADSDMMYASIRVQTNMTTGEETVVFAVPAALLPLVTYNVSLGADDSVTALTATGADSPIRLVYEVSLKEEINEFTLKDIVDTEYLNKNTNADGSVNFYSNQYNVNYNINNIGKEGTINTYSYFNPSKANGNYYHTEASALYVPNGNGYVPYTGNESPASGGTYYHSRKHYKNEGGSLSTVNEYHVLDADAYRFAVKNTETGVWEIPAGTPHVHINSKRMAKTDNLTGTVGYSNDPYIHELENKTETGYHFYAGAVLGNNGKLTLNPGTGFELSKAFSGEGADDTVFNFTVKNLTAPSAEGVYDALFKAADGTVREGTVSFGNGSAEIGLKVGESVKVIGFAEGTQFEISEEISDVFVLTAVNGVPTVETSTKFTAVNGEITSVEFTNALRGLGSLSVAKLIEHNLGDGQTVSARKFKVEITLNDFQGNAVNKTFSAVHTYSDGTTSATEVTFQNGLLTYELAHGEGLEISGITEGSTANVKEILNLSDIFEKTFKPEYWVNGVKGNAATATIVKNRIQEVNITNKYSTPKEVKPVYIKVNGTKTLTDRPDTFGVKFEFELQQYNADGSWTTIGSADVTYVAGTAGTEKAFDFGNAFGTLSYTEAGVYNYRIVEKIPEAPLSYINYDRTVHSFTVNVTDAEMDGQLEIGSVVTHRESTVTITQPTSSDLNWYVTADFTNTYLTDENAVANVAIEIQKSVVNNSGSSYAIPANFRFGLYEDGKTNATFVSDVTNTRGYLRFNLSFTEEGVYSYKLREIDEGKSGWVYDTKEINVNVKVTKDGVGGLTAVIYTDSEVGATNTLSNVTFTNIYDPTPAEKEINFINKKLNGRNLTENDVFKFNVSLVDISGGSETVYDLLTGTNDINGNITFVPSGSSASPANVQVVKDASGKYVLQFNKVGIYYFSASETSESGNGITKDSRTFRFSIEVVDQNGVLKAGAPVVTTVPGNTITFENTYKATPTEFTVSGVKKLSGRVLFKDEFSFILKETKLNGAAIAVPNSWNVKNTSDGTSGTFIFPTLNYSAPGVYEYEVTEVKGNLGGVKYDEAVYTVVITVKDDLAGALKVESATVNGKAYTDSAITFNNTYSADATGDVAIPGGSKVFEVINGEISNVLEGAEFTFDLYLADSAWTIVKTIETVSNGATDSVSGKASFGFSPISYDTAGVYHYIVRETNGGKTIKGVTYDATEYRIVIRVTDDGNGKLQASEPEVNGVANGKVEFKNSYSVVSADPIIISGVKKLNGRVLEEGEFKFILSKSDSNGNVDTTDFTPLESFNAKDGENEGKFEFNAITFDKAGTYYFVVHEDDSDAKTGITYDKSKYLVKIVVTDNGEGKLVAAAPEISKIGVANVETGNGIEFVNEYTTEEETTTVPEETTTVPEETTTAPEETTTAPEETTTAPEETTTSPEETTTAPEETTTSPEETTTSPEETTTVPEETTEAPKETTDPTTPGNPSTGDSSFTKFSLALLCAMGAILTIAYGKRKREEENAE